MAEPPARLITGCRPVAKHHTAEGVDNNEDGVVLSPAWPRLRHHH
ncbi:hypothetical protein Q5425_25095 [Amycolatopsis sp. A133]|nr:hypothetical protein [Amycolatopsis sp. A133]MDQ7807030.1 hypothetical protein [Amycolatopsis sp. A133]